MVEDVLRVIDLRAEFRSARGPVKAVDGVSFSLQPGRTLALVGESGSGKSATALAIPRLLPDPPGRVTGGQVLLRGRDLLELDPDEMPRVRGREIAMVFQEPASALNPVMTVGDQVAESVRTHRRPGGPVRAAVIEALARAGVPAPEKRLRQYPHELSGGLKQRVLIAIALACGPSVLIADEPTTALDVTVQARILDLLAYLGRRLGLALLLITHDLGVVARTAERVAVMYAGRVVETAPVGRFFRSPLHPYSRGLLEAARMTRDDTGSFRVIDGAVPDLADLPSGCRFHPRCAVARLRAACAGPPPPAREAGPGHTVECWYPGEAAVGRAWAGCARAPAGPRPAAAEVNSRSAGL
ncbi:MAG: ABC transporter ATP-binding protein [Bacillota bacterium]|nr:MAG: ABC transporter ATP-binding protein [Bacillota bacterium]